MKLLLSAVSLFLAIAASAASVNLNSGDSITIGGTTVSCNSGGFSPDCQNFSGYVYCTDAPGQRCNNFSGYVYCGWNCENFSGYIYCGATENERCYNFSGYVYCGVKCENFSGYIYCDGQRATPAKPASPAHPR